MSDLGQEELTRRMREHLLDELWRGGLNITDKYGDVFRNPADLFDAIAPCAAAVATQWVEERTAEIKHMNGQRAMQAAADTKTIELLQAERDSLRAELAALRVVAETAKRYAWATNQKNWRAQREALRESLAALPGVSDLPEGL